MWNWLGIILAGLLNGSFAVPMKTARLWKFHHIWMVHSLLAMLIIPWAGVALVVPGWSRLLTSVPPLRWLELFALGLVWGVASLLYGVAVDLLGIALGFGIQLGLSIVLGSLVLMLQQGALSLQSLSGWVYLLGLAGMVVGVLLCAQAGGAKGGASSASREQFRKGLIIALLGGLGAPLLNFGIQYGISLLRAAGQIPADARFSVNTYVAWAIFLSGAAITQAGYCFYRILREHEAAVFTALGTRHDGPWVAVMATVWAASVAVYGMSAVGLGRLGTSLGWPIFIAFIVVTSNLWGVFLGEWKAASQHAFARMLAGSAVLIVAAFLIGQGNR